MQARDVMTTNVVTVTPDVAVEEIARLLLERNISGVPVVDGDDAVLGIVSEGDLMRRPETGAAPRRSWWLEFAASSRWRAAEYIRSHGVTAGDIMTRDVVTVAETANMGEIAEILEERKIKRVPVVRDGKLVGIVSRSNLLQALVARRKEISRAVSVDDHTIREEVLKTILDQGWVPMAAST